MTETFTTLVRLGKALMTTNAKQAFDKFSLAIARDPTDAMLYLYRCQCLQRMKLHECAKIDAETAVRLNPAYWRTHEHLGQVLFHLGEPEAAISAFNLGLQQLEGKESRDEKDEKGIQELRRLIQVAQEEQAGPPADGIVVDGLVAVLLDDAYWYAYIQEIHEPESQPQPKKGKKFKPSPTKRVTTYDIQYAQDLEYEKGVSENRVCKVRLLMGENELLQAGYLGWYITPKSDPVPARVIKLSANKANYMVKFVGSKQRHVPIAQIKTELDARRLTEQAANKEVVARPTPTKTRKRKSVTKDEREEQESKRRRQEIDEAIKEEEEDQLQISEKMSQMDAKHEQDMMQIRILQDVQMSLITSSQAEEDQPLSPSAKPA